MEEVQRDTTELLRVLAPLPKALSLTQGTGSSAQKKDRAVWESLVDQLSDQDLVTILRANLKGIHFNIRRRIALLALQSLCIRAVGDDKVPTYIDQYEDDDRSDDWSDDEEADQSPTTTKRQKRDGDPACAALLFKTVYAMLLEDDPSISRESILELTFPSCFDEEQRKKLGIFCIHNNISHLNGNHIASLTPGGEESDGEVEENKVRELRRLAMWQGRGTGEPSAFALTRLALFRRESDFPLFDAWIRGPLAVSRFAAHFNLPQGLQQDNNNNHNNNDKSEEGRRGVEVLEPRALQEVFSFLDPVSLCRVEQVCMLWRDVSRENLLWERHIRGVVAKQNQTMKSIGHAFDTEAIEAAMQKVMESSGEGENEEKKRKRKTNPKTKTKTKGKGKTKGKALKRSGDNKSTTTNCLKAVFLQSALEHYMKEITDPYHLYTMMDAGLDAIEVSCHPIFLLNGTLKFVATKALAYDHHAALSPERGKSHNVHRIVTTACRCYANAAASSSSASKSLSDVSARVSDIVKLFLTELKAEENIWAVYYGMKISGLLPSTRHHSLPKSIKPTIYYEDSEIQEEYQSSERLRAGEIRKRQHQSDEDVAMTTTPPPPEKEASESGKEKDKDPAGEWKSELLKKFAIRLFTPPKSDPKPPLRRQILARAVYKPPRITLDDRRWYTNDVTRFQYLLDDLENRNWSQTRSLMREKLTHYKASSGNYQVTSLLEKFLAKH